MPSALTDLRDIGKYVAKLIVDDRTLNKMVLVYNEIWTPNQVYDLMEKKSGEKLERSYVCTFPPSTCGTSSYTSIDKSTD